MEKAKNFFSILGLGITIGIILVVILVFVVGAVPKKITVGGVEFEIPTSTPSDLPVQGQQPPQTTNSPTVTANLLPTQIANTPTSVAERIFVSATSAPSYIYVPTITGNYVFQYESGAYSTQPTDDSVLPQFSWHTAVRFFREIKNWRDDQTSMGIASPDWAIDTGTPFRYRESEALSDAQNAMNTGKMSVVIYLEKNVPIYLQIASTSPEDNRGGVWLSVLLQK